MQPVKSSNIAAIGYDRGTLQVQFTNGGIYRYSDVPADVYAKLIAASSIGKHFRQTITGKYKHERVNEEKPT